MALYGSDGLASGLPNSAKMSIQQMQYDNQDDFDDSDYHCVSADDGHVLAADTLSGGGGRGAKESSHVRYQRYAIYVCLVSLVVTVSLGVVGFVGSEKTDNDAAFGFALNCVLDFFSTLVVLWRFWPQTFRLRNSPVSDSSPADLLPQQQAQSAKRKWWLRERRATIGIAMLFVLAFVAVVCKALADIINKQVPNSGLPTVILAAVSSVIFVSMSWVKIRIASVLQSPAMRSDGVNSLAGAAISLGVLISWLATRSHPHVWYVDAFVALIVGLGMFMYAIRVLIAMMSPEARMAPVY